MDLDLIVEKATKNVGQKLLHDVGYSRYQIREIASELPLSIDKKMYKKGIRHIGLIGKYSWGKVHGLDGAQNALIEARERKVPVGAFHEHTYVPRDLYEAMVMYDEHQRAYGNVRTQAASTLSPPEDSLWHDPYFSMGIVRTPRPELRKNLTKLERLHNLIVGKVQDTFYAEFLGNKQNPGILRIFHPRGSHKNGFPADFSSSATSHIIRNKGVFIPISINHENKGGPLPRNTAPRDYKAFVESTLLDGIEKRERNFGKIGEGWLNYAVKDHFLSQVAWNFMNHRHSMGDSYIRVGPLIYSTLFRGEDGEPTRGNGKDGEDKVLGGAARVHALVTRSIQNNPTGTPANIVASAIAEYARDDNVRSSALLHYIDAMRSRLADTAVAHSVSWHPVDMIKKAEEPLQLLPAHSPNIYQSTNIRFDRNRILFYANELKPRLDILEGREPSAYKMSGN